MPLLSLSRRSACASTASGSNRVRAGIVKLPLATNPRAKMQGVSDGFVKIIASEAGVVLGGVVVGPHASDLVFPLTLAVRQRMTVDELSAAPTVYPSISGSIADACSVFWSATEVGARLCE